MDATLGQPAAWMTADPARRAQLDSWVRCHFPLIWRYLRRLGVPEGDADDAAQKVFLTALAKLERIDTGKERAYLLAVAVRVAADTRKALNRRRTEPDSLLEHAPDPGPTPDEALQRRQVAELLDRMLEQLDDDARAVFVLYEVEELTMREIAQALELRPGTVASRLKRGRDQFEAAVKRHRNLQSGGTTP